MIEDETLRNMMLEVVTQAIAEQKSGGKVIGWLAGDSRQAVVGIAVVAGFEAVKVYLPEMGLVIVQSYTALVLQLEPVLTMLVNSWYGPGHNMQTVLNWIVVRARSGAKGK